MKTKLLLGISMMLIAELCFTLLWASVKFSGEHIPVFEIAFFRGLVSVFIIGGAMLVRGIPFRINNKRILLARCVAGYTAMLLSFYSLTKIGLGNAVTLLHTSPIFVAALSPLILKEHSKRSLLLWILIAFVGVIFVVKPNENIFQNNSAFALSAGFLAAIVYMTIRHLHLTDHTFTITFHFTAFVCLASIPFMITDFVTPDLVGWLSLLGAGIFGTLAQLLMTYSYKCGPANIMTPFNNSAIIFSFLFGWIFWSEIPDLWTAIGAIVIIIAIVAISLIVNRKKIPKWLPRISETPVR